MTHVTLSKDGKGVVIHHYEIDESKPSVWVEGSFYHFNKELVKSFKFNRPEDLLLKLK